MNEANVHVMFLGPPLGASIFSFCAFGAHYSANFDVFGVPF